MYLRMFVLIHSSLSNYVLIDILPVDKYSTPVKILIFDSSNYLIRLTDAYSQGRFSIHFTTVKSFSDRTIDKILMRSDNNDQLTCEHFLCVRTIHNFKRNVRSANQLAELFCYL